MRVTQGAFSFLPDMSEEQIRKQIEYCIANNLAVSIEWTDDPHPRNCYWDMWGLPLFDITDPAAIMYEVKECCKLNPSGYVKIQAFDATRGTESCGLAFIVKRPSYEPGFYLERQEVAGRFLRYQISSYAVTQKPEGQRYA